MPAPLSSSHNGPDGKTLVLQAVDLVTLIGQTVALKKRGNRHTGLCPFHSEKSPSFGVDPDKGYWHCFGCKKGGNAIDFVMERDRLEFKDALRQLADQFHIELPRLGNGTREAAGLKQGLIDANAAATTYFEQQLQGPAGQAAREYLSQRGFTDETIKRFRIGYAPEGWGNLAGSPLMKKFKPDLLLQAGLLKSKEQGGRPYDTFRDRLMFPIRDETGRVVAFGGRIMPAADAAAKAKGVSVAKYLNSPETLLFAKSKIAYGLDLGRNKVVETKTVAIVEGYTDVVMAHQFGASNVVATLGTAMTEQHVNLLRRFAGRIVLLFDGDAAGGMAVQRALELFLTQPIDIAIATLPDGVDPDEFLLQNGTEAFDKLLADAEDALTFQWKQMSSRYQTSDDLTAQSKTIEEFLSQIAAARGSGPVDPIRWGGIIVRLAHMTRLPTDDLNRRFKMKPSGPEYALPPAPRPQWGQNKPGFNGGKPPFGGGKPGFGNGTFQKKPFPPRDGQQNQPYSPRRQEQRRYMQGGGFAPPPAQNLPPAPKSPEASSNGVPAARTAAERWLLGGLLNHPAAWQQVQQVISEKDFMTEALLPLAEWYWDHQRNEGEPVLAEVIALLDTGPLKTLAIELASEADAMNNPKTLADAVNFLRQAKQQQADTKLFGQLRRSKEERLGDDFEVDALRKAQDSAGKRSA